MRSNALFAKRHLKVQRRETPNMLLVNRISFSRICSAKVCSLARRQAPQREQRRAQAIAAEGYLKPARAGLAKAKYVDTNNARSLRSRRCGGTPQGNTERSSKKRFEEEISEFKSQPRLEQVGDKRPKQMEHRNHRANLADRIFGNERSFFPIVSQN